MQNGVKTASRTAADHKTGAEQLQSAEPCKEQFQNGFRMGVELRTDKGTSAEWSRMDEECKTGAEHLQNGCRMKKGYITGAEQ